MRAEQQKGIHMKKMILRMSAAIGLLLCAGELCAQELVINSFDSGRITWTSPSLNVTCRVQQATSLDGSWTNLQAILVTNPSNETDVAMTEATMFYRLMYVMPDPHFPDITAEPSLALIINRDEDPDFVIIDVRTPSEYGDGHIIDALNIDYRSDTFEAELGALDTNRVYLVYCGSGGRSDGAHGKMLGLGFHEVYNMLGGMGDFEDVPGADAYITDP